MEAKGGEGKGGGGPRFVLPEEDEATSSRLRSTSPRNTTNNTSKAKEEEREDEKQWTVAELRGWAARLDQRERAVAEREASLDQRAQWLDQQQARVFRMSVERYHALQALDDQAVLRMQTIVRAWLRRRQWLKNMIRMKSCDDEAIVKMRRRASALKEIVISEQSYIRSLQVLLMEFLVPIVEGGVLKDDEHMGVSFIIGHVLSVNKQFHVAMQKKYGQWPTKHSFAEVFLEHIPLMKKAYANYIAVFDHITAVLLDHSNKKKSPLSAFLEEKMTKGGLDLKAYLIMPVQRLPRYEILLTELIKNTFPEHSDYEQLQKALAKVKKMNSYVDLKKREIDIKKEFLQIQQRQEKKVDHYIKQGKDMTLTTFSDLRELLTNKKQGDTPDRPRRDKSAAPEKERAFSKTSMLKVCILEGRHLTPTTHDEAPNPYCVVTVGKQSYKSKKKTKTFHPSWSNATFVFDVNDLQGQVEIECWDANNLIKTEMLGRVALNIADVITLGRPDRVDTQPLRQGEEDEEGEGTEIRSLEGKPRWCSLMDPEYGRSKTGELRVSFHYMRAEEEVERLRLLADAQRKREDASGEHVTHMVVNKANHAARRQQHLRQHSTSSGATVGNDSSNASDDDASLLSTSSDVYDNQEGEEWERPLSRDGSVIVDTSDHHHHHHGGVDSSKTRKKEKRKSTTLKEMLGEIKKKGNTLHRRTRSVDNKQSSAIDTGDRPEAAAAVAREKASEPGSRGSGKKEKRKTGANALPPSKMSTPGVVGGDDEVSTTPSPAPSPGSGSGSSVSSSLPAVVAGGRCSPTTARRIMSSDSVVRGPHMPEHPEEAPEEWELSAQITLAKGRTATTTTSSAADDVDGEKPAAVPRSRGSGAHKKNAPAPAATSSAAIAKSVSDSPRARSPRPSSTYTPASPSSSPSSASSVSVSASFSSVPVNSKEERLTLRLDAAKRHEKQEKEKEKEKAKEKKAAAEDKKERKREDKTEKNEAKKPSDSAAAPVSAVQLSPRAQPPPEHRVADQPSPPPPESSSSSGRDKAKEATETTAATIATVGLMTASGGSGSGSGSGSSGAVPCSPKGRFLTPEELAEVIREKRAASPRARLDLAAASKKKKEEEAEAEAQKEEEEKRRKKNETGAKKNEDEGEDEEETDSEDERSLEKARAKARRLRERSFQRDASSSSSDESD